MRPSQKVRDLVDEYARLASELKCADTEHYDVRDIWDRMGFIDLELIDLGYCLQETPTAAYVFPIGDYYVATFGESPSRTA